MGVGSVPAAVGGVYVLHRLEHAYGSSFDNGLLIAVAAALMFTGLAVLARAVFLPNLVARERSDFVMTRRDKIAPWCSACSWGSCWALTSAGSGSLIAVGLIMIFRLVPTRVVGTDVFHAAVLLWAAAIAHVVAGNVDFALAGTILIGSVPGVWIGSGLATTLPEGTLRPALAIVLLAAGLALLNKAGLDFPIYVIFLGPAVVAVAVVALHLLRERAARARAALSVSDHAHTTPTPESA